jgi:DNA-binding transcriptional LysR family regulator
MNINLRDLQYFAVVAKHRHLGRAAESLGLSQPALSMSLRRLERHMQTKLVRRTPKGVDLTASGEAVFAHARRLRLSVEEISREVADLSEGRAGHLRVGTGAGSALNLVPTACAALRKEAPNVTLEMVTGERHNMLTSLRNGELDLVVTTVHAFPNENLLSEDPLYDQPFVVFASARNPLTRRKQVALSDLAQERWALTPAGNFAQRRLSQLFEQSGLPPPSIALETTNLVSITHLVAASELLGFTSRQTVRYAAAHDPIAEVRVKDLSVTRRIGVIYRKDAYLSPATRRFIEILKKTAEKIAPENG